MNLILHFIVVSTKYSGKCSTYIFLRIANVLRICELSLLIRGRAKPGSLLIRTIPKTFALVCKRCLSSFYCFTRIYPYAQTPSVKRQIFLISIIRSMIPLCVIHCVRKQRARQVSRENYTSLQDRREWLSYSDFERDRKFCNGSVSSFNYEDLSTVELSYRNCLTMSAQLARSLWWKKTRFL